MSKQNQKIEKVSSVPNNSVEEALIEAIDEVWKCETQVSQADEDFILVDLADEDESARICENSVLERNIQPSEGCCQNIVQSSTEYDSLKEGLSDCDNDLLLEDEEILEATYINECTKKQVKPFKANRPKYPKPYFLKVREHGISVGKKEHVRQNDKNNSEESKLLPKVKLDDSTTKTLVDLIKCGYVGQINQIVHNSKKNMVFLANSSKHNCITTPMYIAVKIYKTSKDKDVNEIIYKQVQREFEHLTILFNSKVLRHDSLNPLKARKNVILTGFIGNTKYNNDSKVAPTIEEFTSEYDKTIYNVIVNYLDKWYNNANLVHGNLSAKKILCEQFCKGVPMIRVTGWLHSVKKRHPLALPKLMKDCHFVTEFFKKRGVAVMMTIDLFKQITRQETVKDNLLKIFQDKDLYAKYDSNPNRKENMTLKANKRFK